MRKSEFNDFLKFIEERVDKLDAMATQIRNLIKTPNAGMLGLFRGSDKNDIHKEIFNRMCIDIESEREYYYNVYKTRYEKKKSYGIIHAVSVLNNSNNGQNKHRIEKLKDDYINIINVVFDKLLNDCSRIEEFTQYAKKYEDEINNKFYELVGDSYKGKYNESPFVISFDKRKHKQFDESKGLTVWYIEENIDQDFKVVIDCHNLKKYFSHLDPSDNAARHYSADGDYKSFEEYMFKVLKNEIVDFDIKKIETVLKNIRHLKDIRNSGLSSEFFSVKVDVSKLSNSIQELSKNKLNLVVNESDVYLTYGNEYIAVDDNLNQNVFEYLKNCA